MHTNTISLNMPFDLVKSERDGEMRIGGYASTADRDRENEAIIQKNLDIQEFLDSGFFNLEHDPSKILGYPDKSRCTIDQRGLYVEGILLNGVPEAESVYRSAVALKKSRTGRRLGFSVEGQILSRRPDGLITRARVLNVAITAKPANPKCTWDALCKSFAPYCETLEQSEMSFPYDGGYPLASESLDTAFRNLADIIGQNEAVLENMEALKAMLSNRERITKNEYALYLALTRDLTYPESMEIADNIIFE